MISKLKADTSHQIKELANFYEKKLSLLKRRITSKSITTEKIHNIVTQY